MNKRAWILSLGVLGLCVVLVYLGAALGIIREVNNLILALVFGIGPVAIIGVVEIYGRISSKKTSLTLKAGTVFLVVAFALFNLMLVVQQTVRLRTDKMISQTGELAEKEMLSAIETVVDFVQQGVDVSFDIFYCLGLILLSTAMYSHRDFGRILGIFGVVSGASLLVLNLAAFPEVPAESGLVDLGPVTAVWWLWVIIQLMRKKKQEGTGPFEAA